MKKIITALLLCLPLLMVANDNYLVGAVPEVNGRVVFRQAFAAKGKNKQQVYETMLTHVKTVMKQEKILEQTKILLDNATTGEIVVRFEEWMVFKKKPLVYDRTRIYYQLNIKCEDEKCTLEMTNIRYYYDEERDNGLGGTRYKAEEWITDKYGLNKSKTKLAKVSGKFRRKTIDLKNDLFSSSRRAFGERVIVESATEILE